jgi:hypothetical protein
MTYCGSKLNKFGSLFRLNGQHQKVEFTTVQIKCSPGFNEPKDEGKKYEKQNRNRVAIGDGRSLRRTGLCWN